MGSDEIESHFNGSLIVGTKPQDCPRTTIFEEKGELKQIFFFGNRQAKLQLVSLTDYNFCFWYIYPVKYQKLSVNVNPEVTWLS